ncbi:MAG: hypothetical protein NVS2B11_12410 [Acetobacteraceae bacterium]
MALSDNANATAQDAKEQIAQLREQVQSLMSERVTPALANAADTAQQYAQQAKDMYEDQSEMLSERVRESPIMAILIAAGVGYLLGRGGGIAPPPDRASAGDARRLRRRRRGLRHRSLRAVACRRLRPVAQLG